MPTQKPILYVEGPDDCHVIINLMMIHGVPWEKGQEPVAVKPQKSVSALLDGISVAVKTALKNCQNVGFVLDIDEDVASRWESVRARLIAGGLPINEDEESPGKEGLVVDCSGTKIGVWMMPDNISPKGKLEDFLAELIPPSDAHYDMAREFVSRASECDAPRKFELKDRSKAELSAYLAVKDPPGNPYGTAIKARVFSEDREVATLFVAWFKKLYQLP